MASRPPSPTSGKGYFSAPFERFSRDEASDWASAFTLLGAFSWISGIWVAVYTPFQTPWKPILIHMLTSFNANFRNTVIAWRWRRRKHSKFGICRGISWQRILNESSNISGWRYGWLLQGVCALLTRFISSSQRGWPRWLLHGSLRKLSEHARNSLSFSESCRCFSPHWYSEWHHSSYGCYSSRTLDLRIFSSVQMGAYRVHTAGVISPTLACLYLQETCMALFPFRFVLLRHCPELHLHLATAIQSSTFRRLLLSFPWITCKCCYNLEKFFGLSWLR